MINSKRTLIPVAIILVLTGLLPAFSQNVAIWTRFEKDFTSSKQYTNPLYDVKFNIRFTSPTGREKNIRGFWDGERSWKVRFMPDEKGI